MCHQRWGTATRRAALALLPWLCLAAVGPGCLPAGPAPRGATGIPDRLEKMRTLRGTGDPRQQGKRSSIRERRKSAPRWLAARIGCRWLDIPAPSSWASPGPQTSS
jgi:hypothetical protein